MPTYLYACDEGHEIEVIQGIKDDVLTECQFMTLINQEELEGIAGYGKPGKFTKCMAPCRRLIAGCTFVLKGGGWTPKGGS
jgi:predicted nucleic acid-binding Zn ribbon protein